MVQLLFGLIRFRWPLTPPPPATTTLALASARRNSPPRKKMDPFVDDSLSAASDDDCDMDTSAIIEPKALRSFVSHAATTDTHASKPEQHEEEGEAEKIESFEMELEIEEDKSQHAEEGEEMFSNIAPATIHQIETNAYFNPRKQSTTTSQSHSHSLVSMSEREWGSFQPTRIQGPEHINRWSGIDDEYLPETLRWNDANRRTAISMRDEYGSRSRVITGNRANLPPVPQLGVGQRLRSIGRLFSKEIDCDYETRSANCVYGDRERPWDSRIHDALRRADSSYATEEKEPSTIEIISAINSVRDDREERRSAKIKTLLKGKRSTTRRRKTAVPNNIPKWPSQLRKVKTGLQPEWWGP